MRLRIQSNKKKGNRQPVSTRGQSIAVSVRIREITIRKEMGTGKVIFYLWTSVSSTSMHYYSHVPMSRSGPWERGWHCLASPKKRTQKPSSPPSRAFTIKALLTFYFILFVYLFVYYHYFFGWLGGGGGGGGGGGKGGPLKAILWLRPTRKWEQSVPSAWSPIKKFINVLKGKKKGCIELFHFTWSIPPKVCLKRTSTHRWAIVQTSKRDCIQELHSSDLTICRGKMWNNAYNHSGERRRVQPLCLTCFESYDSTRGKKFRANDFRTIYYLLISFQQWRRGWGNPINTIRGSKKSVT